MATKKKVFKKKTIETKEIQKPMSKKVTIVAVRNFRLFGKVIVEGESISLDSDTAEMVLTQTNAFIKK